MTTTFIQVVRDAERLAHTYHARTQRLLHGINTVASSIHDSIDENIYAADKRYHSVSYQDPKTTKTLRNILDGGTDRLWQDRYETFKDALPRTQPATDTAYLHGYIDAKQYLWEEHPGLAHQFHDALQATTTTYYLPEQDLWPYQPRQTVYTYKAMRI